MRKKIIFTILILFATVFFYYLSYNFNNNAVNNAHSGNTSKDNTIDITPSPGTEQNSSHLKDKQEIDQEPVTDSKPAEGNEETSPSQEQKKDQNAAKPQPVDPKELEKEIVDKYTAQLQTLKSENLSSLNALVGEAKAEYKKLCDENKESKKISLALKYINKAKALEGQSDSKFKAIVSAMESELKQNKLSTTAVSDTKKQYNEEKSSTRSTLMAKAFK